MKVIITNRAKRDLMALFDYNTKKSINYAIRIDKKIRLYIRTLKDFPYIGRFVPEILNKHYRERICEKFRIVYYVSEKENIIYIRYIFNAIQYKKTFFDLYINQNF